MAHLCYLHEIYFNTSVNNVIFVNNLTFRERANDHRFSHLEKGKGNTDRGKNGKRNNTLYSILNQAIGSLWELFVYTIKEELMHMRHIREP